MGMTGWDSARRGRPGCPRPSTSQIGQWLVPSIGVSVWIIDRQQDALAGHAIGGAW